MSVMLFVEDPGAANYAAGLPQAGGERSMTINLHASGHACHTLEAHGVTYERAGDRASLVASVRDAQAVVVGTAEAADAMGLSLIGLAKEAGVPSVGLVDGPANAAHRFRGASDQPLRHAPNWLAVPDEGTRRRFIELGFREDRVRACGHPFHDRVRAMRGSLTGEATARRTAFWPNAGDRKIVVFAAELSAGLDDAEFRRSGAYTLSGTSGSDLRTDVVLDEFLLAASALDPKPYLLLRLHPKTPRAMFARYIDAFDAVSEGGPAQPVLAAADAVVGLTSVVLDEAALLGKPVLSILPRECEREWLLGATLGFVPVATRRAEVMPLLSAALAIKKPDLAAIDRLTPPGASANILDLIETAIADKNHEDNANPSQRHHA